MRVARGLFTTILLVVFAAPVSVSAPPIADARTQCIAMIPEMRAGYRALEHRQYVQADRLFDTAANEYIICRYSAPENSLGDAPWGSYWRSYALAGRAAAKFGAGKIAEGLQFVDLAEAGFLDVSNGTGMGEGASKNLRGAASGGLAYVRSLESAKKPLLPKIWLDWKAAHPSG